MEKIEAFDSIKRLSGLRGYEKLKDELLRVGEKYGKNRTHIFTVITEILESETTCPTPATLKGFLTAGQVKEDDGWKTHRVCPYNLCVGDGWRVRYSLHTQSSSGLTREDITAEQAAALKGKLDAKKQTVYEGVEPCKCGGSGV